MTTQFMTPAGTTLEISASLPATEDAVGYGALVYADLELPTELGEVGPTDNIVTYIPLRDPTVQKAQGSRDYGSQTLPMAYTSSDAALDILISAHENRSNVSCKMTYPDGAIRYYQAKCDGIREQVGAADSVLGLTTTLHITTKVIKVAAPS